MGIAHEKDDIEALRSLLASRGVLSPTKSTGIWREETETILRIRIDPVRSPVEGIPPAPRRPLFDIFEKHAMGAVVLRRKRWVKIELADLIGTAGETDPGSEMCNP